MTEEELVGLLHERGMRVTSQRVLIHRVLGAQGGHHSAEGLLELVEPLLPGLSQQTVYNTLSVLADLGAVRRVATPGGSTRFEARLDPHHHAVCGSCGAIEDLDADVPTDPAVVAAVGHGFVADTASVTVLGRCARCAAAG